MRSDRPRRGRRADQPGPGASGSACSTCPTLPATGQRPAPAGRRAGQRVPAAGAGERVLALTSLEPDWPRPGARHPPGRRQAGQPRGARTATSWEVIALADGDEVVGAVELRTGDEDALLRHLRRPAAALRRPTAVRPAGPLRRRHRRRPARRRRAGRVVRRLRARRRRRRGHRLRVVAPRCPAPSPARSRSRRSRSTPPRAAAPAACAATASSRARTPWSSPGPAPARPGPLPPAVPPVDLPEATGRRDGSGVPGQPADRRGRRPGRARLGDARDRRARRVAGWRMSRWPPVCARAAARRRRVLALAPAGCTGQATTRRRRTRPRRGAGARQEDPRRDPGRADRARRPPKLPDGVNGLAHRRRASAPTPPAFEGRHQGRRERLTVDADVVAVDGKVYAKLPFTSAFAAIDPADYGAPDPADLMDPEGGLSSLLTAAENVEAGEQVRGATRTRVLTELHRHRARRGGRRGHPERRRRRRLRRDVHGHRRRRAPPRPC